MISTSVTYSSLTTAAWIGDAPMVLDECVSKAFVDDVRQGRVSLRPRSLVQTQNV